MRRAGFSLLEVVFTASVLAVGLMLLMNLFPTVLVSTRVAESRSRAAAVASAVLDECRSRSFELLKVDSDSDVSTPGALGDLLRRCQQTGTDGIVFAPTLHVTGDPLAASLPRDSLALVTVRVSWSQRGPRSLTRSMRIANLNR